MNYHRFIIVALLWLLHANAALAQGVGCGIREIASRQLMGYPDSMGIVDGELVVYTFRENFPRRFFRMYRYDMSDPSDPACINDVDLGERENLWLTRGDVMFEFERERLRVYDISHRTIRQLLGIQQMPGVETVSVAWYAGYLYASTEDLGPGYNRKLMIFDVKDPTTIDLVRTLSLSQDLGLIFSQIEVHDGILYGYGGEHGVRMFDLRDPAAPEEIPWSLTLPSGRMLDYSVFDGVIYARSEDESMYSIDVRDPRSQRLLDEAPGVAFRADAASGDWLLSDDTTSSFNMHHRDDLSVWRYGLELSVADRFQEYAANDAFVALAGVDSVLRICTPPGEASRAPMTPLGLGEPRVFAVEEPFLYIRRVGIHDDTLEIWKRGTSGAFIHVNDYVMHWSVEQIEDFVVRGGIAYAALSFDGYAVLDLRDPMNPREIARSLRYRPLEDIRVDGDLLIAADAQGDLQLIDISDPMDPALLGELQRDGYRGDYVYRDGLVFDFIRHLRIFDVRDPTHPVLLSRTPDLPRIVGGYVIEGDRVYAHLDRRLYVYDISDPSSPELILEQDIEIGFAFGGQSMHEGQLVGMYQYGGGMIVDASDPADLHPLRVFGLGDDLEYSGSQRMAMDGDLLYVLMRAVRSPHGYFLQEINIDGACVCPVDLSGDGMLDYFDIAAFMLAFLERDPVADINTDGSIDVLDVMSYLQRFNAGCP